MKVNRIKHAVRSVQWHFSKDDVDRFRAEITSHSNAIQMLLATAQTTYLKASNVGLMTRIEAAERNAKASNDQQSAILAEIRDKIEENKQLITLGNSMRATMLQRWRWITQLGTEVRTFMQGILHMNVSIYQELVFIRKRVAMTFCQAPSEELFILEDALGRVAPVHLRFISSWKAFDAILEVRFEGRNGHSKVKRKDYVLVEKGTGLEIDRERDWALAFMPGQHINMSLIFRRPETANYEQQHDNALCPYCGTSSAHGSDKESQWQVSHLSHRLKSCADISTSPDCKRWFSRIVELCDEEPDPTNASSSTQENTAANGDCLHEPSKPSLKRAAPEDSDDEDEMTDFMRVRLIARRKRRRVRAAHESRLAAESNNLSEPPMPSIQSLKRPAPQSLEDEGDMMDWTSAEHPVPRKRRRVEDSCESLATVESVQTSESLPVAPAETTSIPPVASTAALAGVAGATEPAISAAPDHGQATASLTRSDDCREGFDFSFGHLYDLELDAENDAASPTSVDVGPITKECTATPHAQTIDPGSNSSISPDDKDQSKAPVSSEAYTTAGYHSKFAAARSGKDTATSYYLSPYNYSTPPRPWQANGKNYYYSPRQYVYDAAPSREGAVRSNRKPMYTYAEPDARPRKYAKCLREKDSQRQLPLERTEDYIPRYVPSEQHRSQENASYSRSSRAQPPSRPKPTRARSATSPPAQATEAQARAAGIPAGYSYRHWDPTEEPILLLGSVFDANSLGKWIYDWTIFVHGPATPMSEIAGDLWLLLIQLAGKIKRAEECMPRIRQAASRNLVDDFLETGERLWHRFNKLLKICEKYMWKAAKKNAKKESGDAEPAKITMTNDSGCEFVSSIFGRDRELERTEKLMSGIRLWSMRFDANCDDILRNPAA